MTQRPTSTSAVGEVTPVVRTVPGAGKFANAVFSPLVVPVKKEADVARELFEQAKPAQAETERVQQHKAQQKQREWYYPEFSLATLNLFIVLSGFLAVIGSVLLIVAGTQFGRLDIPGPGDVASNFGRGFDDATRIMLFLLVPPWVIMTLLPAVVIKTVMYYLERITIGVERLHSQSQ